MGSGFEKIGFYTDLLFGALGSLHIGKYMAAKFGSMFKIFTFINLGHGSTFDSLTNPILFAIIAGYHLLRLIDYLIHRKSKESDKSIFDSYILAGNTLRAMGHFSEAILQYEKALNLKFNDEKATNKINECKHLIDTHK